MLQDVLTLLWGLSVKSLAAILLIGIIGLYLPAQAMMAQTRKVKPLPPGPKGLPLIGNLHQQSWTEPWKTYQQWHKQYGPIVSFKLGPYQAISIGNHQVSRDLLEKRGAIYSSRPQTLWSQFKAKGLQPVFQPYVEKWKTLHKMQARLLGSRMIPTYAPLLDVESKQLLVNMLLSNKLSTIFDRYAFSIASTLITGERVHTAIEATFHAMRRLIDDFFADLHLTFFLTDYIPGIRYLPLGDQFFNRTLRVFDKCFRRALANNTWNWTRAMKNDSGFKRIGWAQTCFGLGELWTALTATTPVMLLLFTQLSIQNPKQYERLQQEIDSVVGADRLPEAADIEKMAYLKAFVAEMLRLESIIPLGLMRSVDQDDEYMGYHIPKGSIIIPNTWCLDHDESVFPKPDAFLPERWLLRPELPLAAFGFGRRKCPGRLLAYQSLYLTIARIVWTFNIVAPEGGVPPSEYHSFFISPNDFRDVYEPRSELHADFVEDEWELVEKDDDALAVLIAAGQQAGAAAA